MDFVGFLLAAIGAVLICSHGRWAHYGFMTVLVSNAAWIAYSLTLGQAGFWLVMQYAFFFCINCWGLSGALKRRRLDAARERAAVPMQVPRPATD